MKALVWDNDKMGANYDEIDIPEDYVEEAEAAREKLLDEASSFDDDLMEKVLEGEEISEEQLKAAVVRIQTD